MRKSLMIPISTTNSSEVFSHPFLILSLSLSVCVCVCVCVCGVFSISLVCERVSCHNTIANKRVIRGVMVGDHCRARGEWYGRCDRPDGAWP